MTARLHILDPVRFVAALSVVFYHLAAMPQQTWAIASVAKFGYLGVPLFFIISGFVIAMSATNRSAWQFALSRFLRLYPTYWAAIAVTVLLAGWLTGEQFSLRRILTNLTMLNVYFGEANIDGVYWTLLQELKFYVCVGLLVWTGTFGRHRVWMSAWIVLAYSFALTGQPFFLGWFISPDYSAYFIIGIALYLIHAQTDRGFGFAAMLAALPLALERAYTLAPEFIDNLGRYDKLIAAAIVLAIVAFLLAVALGRLQLAARPWYLVIGGLTYPLYLIHNVIGKAIVARLPLSEAASVVVAIAIVLLGSWAIYRLIDVGLVPRLRRRILAVTRRQPAVNAT